MPWVRKTAAAIAASWLVATPAFSQVAISQLPAATTLGGTEVAPVVQSGTTVKATMAQISAYVVSQAHTWGLAQTFSSSAVFSVAPTFTDQAGSRTALGLGTAATQNTGTSGANVPLLNGANTWSGASSYTAQQTFSGATGSLAALFNNAQEVATVSATAATGTINYDVTTQSVLYYTTNASGNWTLNIRGNSSTTLNSLLSTGQSITVAFLATQGASPFYNNVVQVDGTAVGVTTKWQGGAPSAGNASGVDVYTYTIVKTGSATYTIFATQVQFS